MKVKKLEELLSQLQTFKKPNIKYEQYATSPHIASYMLHTAQTHYNSIEDRVVADLGMGCGVLSVGASILGASIVTGFDIDSNALSISLENCQEFDTIVEMVCCDILNYLPDKFEKCFDTVVMNPPFGTKNNEGMDMKFLEIASKVAIEDIYSLHKTSTRPYVLKKGEQLGLKGDVLAELRYDLPSTYKFHKKASVDIQVDFIRFSIAE